VGVLPLITPNYTRTASPKGRMSNLWLKSSYDLTPPRYLSGAAKGGRM